MACAQLMGCDSLPRRLPSPMPKNGALGTSMRIAASGLSAQARHLQTDEPSASELDETTCVRYALDSTATGLLLVPGLPFARPLLWH